MNPNMRLPAPEPEAMATLTVGSHTIEMPETEALTLFAVAAACVRFGGTVALNPDTMVIVSQGTPVSITTRGAFADQCNPDQQLTASLKKHKMSSPDGRKVAVIP